MSVQSIQAKNFTQPESGQYAADRDFQKAAQALNINEMISLLDLVSNPNQPILYTNELALLIHEENSSLCNCDLSPSEDISEDRFITPLYLAVLANSPRLVAKLLDCGVAPTAEAFLWKKLR